MTSIFILKSNARTYLTLPLINTAETLIQGNTELVEHVYEKFAALPPRLRKSSLRATAACADGFARALDLRMCGDVCDARFVGLGGLTCAAASGEDIVFVGGEDGRVAAVDARNDGVSFFLVKNRVAARAGSGVSCLSVAPGGGALAAGWDDGTVAVFAET